MDFMKINTLYLAVLFNGQSTQNYESQILK
jgi:hypothetical protein